VELENKGENDSHINVWSVTNKLSRAVNARVTLNQDTITGQPPLIKF